MSKISTYNNASPVTLSDKLIGTSVGATPANATKNFLVSDLATLIGANIDKTLQQVLDAGNTATQNFVLTGDITQVGGYDFSGGSFTTAAGAPMVMNGPLVVNDSVRLTCVVKDNSDSLGTLGQALISDASSQATWQELSVGKLELPVRYAEAVAKGDPLYISGYNVGQSRLEVSKADSASAATMPAIGVADAAYAMNDNGTALSIGSLTGIDLSTLVPAPSVGDVLYIASGGGLTKTAPTGTALIQNVGIVSRNSGANGGIEVTAIGRANALPNITPSSVLFGGTAGQASESLQLTYTEQNITQGAATFAGKTDISTGLFKLPQLRTFADNAAALAGDLLVNDVYKTATGELRIVV